MSPIHSFDLSNFSDTPNEVIETHSPYMFSNEQQNTPSPNTSPSSGEDGGGVVDQEQSQAKKIKLEMDDEDERREIKTESKVSNETEHDDGRTGNECNDIDESALRRPVDSAMSNSSRRSSGHDVHDDSDSSKHGHTDAENVRSNSKQFEILLSGSDNLVDSQISRSDLNAVGDDQFEIDTNHSTLNFDCFGTVNDDVMESAFDEGVLCGVDCEKSSTKNVESGSEQRRNDADNSDDDDSGDSSGDSSENDDDSSDSDDSDDESNTPNDDVNKMNASTEVTATAATTEKTDAGSKSSNEKKDEENGTREKNIDSDNFDAIEAKRTKDNDGSLADIRDASSAKSFEMTMESAVATDDERKNATHETSERNPSDGNENSNNSGGDAHTNDKSNDKNGTKLVGEAANSAESTSTNIEKKRGDENSEKIGEKSKRLSEPLNTVANSKRTKSEPNSRNISPQHRSDDGNGNHSADEVLLGNKEINATKMTFAMAELRKNAERIGHTGGGNDENTKKEPSGATRNLLDTAMDILRDTGDDKSSDNFGLGSDAVDALESNTHLGDSPGINLDDSVNLESLDAVANLLSSTDLDLDSDDNHDIFSALDNDQLDSISDSNSDDGIGHSTVKDVKPESSDLIDDKVAKSESVAATANAAVANDESKSSSNETKSLPCLEYKSWTSDNPANDAVEASEASSAIVKSDNVTTADSEPVEKSSAIDALVNAPLITSIKRELDCNEAMSNDTEEDSNGNDFRAAIELELKRRQSPAENALESIEKMENEIETISENIVVVAAAAANVEDEMVTKLNSSEKNRRNEKDKEATTTNDEKSDRNNNSDRARKGKKRSRPQFHEPTILRPRPPFNFDCLANRPLLRSHNYESLTSDDIGELNPCMLYDYSTLEAWMNHPVKRFKPNEPMTPVQRLAAAQASQKIKPALQELYNKQNVVMANWTTSVSSNNNNETKPLAGSTGSTESPNIDTQSDYDDDDSNAELSPSNLSELSPYGNIDILDPEDLDCFSEDFVHVSYRRTFM